MEKHKERLVIDAVTTAINIVQEKWEEKKAAIVLFPDMKRAFDYVSKEQLFTYMLTFKVNNDLVTQTNFFLTYQKVPLVIDGHENKKQKLKSEFLIASQYQSLFSLYISVRLSTKYQKLVLGYLFFIL